MISILLCHQIFFAWGFFSGGKFKCVCLISFFLFLLLFLFVFILISASRICRSLVLVVLAQAHTCIRSMELQI